jgi:hypothetical protein
MDSVEAMGIGRYQRPGVTVSPASLVYLQPEILAKYSQVAVPASPCATPTERRWAVLACIAFLILVPVLIGMSA